MRSSGHNRDIEETEALLDAEEPSTIEFWEKKQRELITSVVDYNLATLASLIDTKAIDLSPAYQRRFRWDAKRQSKLIESFLMNVPVPPIFLNEDAYGHYSVIDGKQRLLTVQEFLRGRLILANLEVFSDINGLTYDGLPSKLQTVIRTRPTLRAVIILRQSDEDVKFEVFRRLNTGGVHLNAQEIRNSTCTGPFNDSILKLSVSREFHRILGIRNKETSAIYQEMRDAELVLRYFTFRENWHTFSSGIRRQMDRFMEDNRQMEKEKREELEKEFLSTIGSVEACFGDHAFRRWLPEEGKWKRQVLASLYDAQMFACRGINPERARKRQEKILPALEKLFSNADFRKAIDAATNTPAFFKLRIQMTKNLLREVIG